MTRCAFTSNQAVGGAAGKRGSPGQGLGGGIYVASLATAGGVGADVTGNRASTGNEDEFGALSSHS